MNNINNHSVLRIIIDGLLPGVVNMAVDESILQAVNGGTSPATLRFYRWDEPTISLGYFQKHEDLVLQDEVIRKMPVVRRQTGGGAILHDDELTYSLVLPLNEPKQLTNIENLYQLVHDGYLTALAELGVRAEYRGGTDSGNAQRGPFFCFARRHRLDLVVDGDKLLGSAQRRIRNAVLQHGSLILARHFHQQPCAQLKEAATVKGPIDLNTLIGDVTDYISGQLRLKRVDGKLSDKEQEQSVKLQNKYNGHEWNRQR
jgi:lipoate-protein ligase A